LPLKKKKRSSEPTDQLPFQVPTTDAPEAALPDVPPQPMPRRGNNRNSVVNPYNPRVKTS